jgi:hypothetical protein
MTTTRAQSQSALTTSGFSRSRKRECLICGKAHRYHCSVTEDGALAICKYVPSKSQARDGRWIHVLRELSPLERARALAQKSRLDETDRRAEANADTDRRDAVYRYMLGDCLLLTPEHGDALLERGLGDTMIASRLYVSAPTPKRASDVCDELASRFSLENVPGFFREGGRWRLNIHEYNHPGILIPVCDVCGRIAAIQIRRDTEADPRYVWLSSSRKPHGVTSGAPVHFAQPDLVKRTGRAIITEGSLKADVCAEMLGCCFAGIAGVDVFPSNFGASLRADLPDLREVIIGYDADWRRNDAVRKALMRLCAAARAADLRVRMWDWDRGNGKGLDDYLVARERKTT